MSKKVNYWTCDFGEEMDEFLENTFGPFPCNHPENLDGDCPLTNKKTGQLDECQLLNR